MELLASLQVLQNRAARAVTGKSWFTPTRRLLEDCKWLSVRQLVFYQTVMGVHKAVVSGKPDHLSKKFSTDHPYRTRQATSGGLRYGEDYDGKSGLSHSSFCYRGTVAYNRIPVHIRQTNTMQTFKYKLKQWVSTNIPLD